MKGAKTLFGTDCVTNNVQGYGINLAATSDPAQD